MRRAKLRSSPSPRESLSGGAVFFRRCLCDGRASVSEFGLKRVSAPRQAQRMGRPIPARCDGPADFGGTAASGQRSPALNHPSSLPTQGGLGRKHLSGTLQLNCKSCGIRYGNDPFLEPLNPTAYSSSWQLRQGTARPTRRYSKVKLNCYSSRISQRLDDPIEGGKIAPGSFCERVFFRIRLGSCPLAVHSNDRVPVYVGRSIGSVSSPLNPALVQYSAPTATARRRARRNCAKKPKNHLPNSKAVPFWRS